ncbi:hypothetical protein [Paramicrobacterium humi]|uniref:hypothetical protein n=1 Tax=Paramicrobacterium humi TaxID=640635 RepID=UPI00115FE7D0|nr:hypothetical protein [Microbacterium humi]
MTYLPPESYDPGVTPARERARPGAGQRVGTAVLTFVLGLVYGTVGTVAHPAKVTLLGVPIPYGLVLALLGVLALLLGLRLVLADRLPVLSAAVGLVGIVVLFSFRSVGGSVLIAQGIVGMVWLFVVPLVAALVLAWPRMPVMGSRSPAA